MFAAALREHKARDVQHKQHITECRAALLSAVECTSDAAMADVNTRLVDALNNQKKIEHDTRQIQLQSAQLTKQMDRWVAMYGGLNTSVKELGDLSNWAATMQADMDSVANTLNRLMQQRQQQRRDEVERRRAVQPTVSPAVVSAALPDVRAKPQPI